MRAYVVVDQFPRLLTIQDFIDRNTRAALYQVIGTNRHVALIDHNNRPLNNIFELVVPEEHKVPLWKQSMELQMGRIPKTTTQSSKIMKLRQITAEEGSSYKYKLYIASL